MVYYSRSNRRFSFECLWCSPVNPKRWQRVPKSRLIELDKSSLLQIFVLIEIFLGLEESLLDFFGHSEAPRERLRPIPDEPNVTRDVRIVWRRRYRERMSLPEAELWAVQEEPHSCFIPEAGFLESQLEAI